MSTTNSTTVRVADYFRMSRDVQEESIERQKSQVDPYTAAKGYTVVAVFTDEGIAGSETEKRPGLQAMIKAAQAGKFDGIVVDDLKRLVRLDGWDATEELNTLRKAGVWIESVAKGRYNYDKVGRLMIYLESEAGNEQLRDSARNALTKQLRDARDDGKPPLPKTVYGYRREVIAGEFRRKKDGRLLPLFRWALDDLAADVVRSIFRWYAEGRSPGWIADELERRGARTPTGKRHWRRATIRGILANGIYVGDRAWGKTASGKFSRLGPGGSIVEGDGKRRTEHRPREEWFFSTEEDGIPPLVDRALFSVCQSRLNREGDIVSPNGQRHRRCQTTPSTEPGAFLLSRVLVCGRCGGWMTGSKTPKRCKPGVFYVCSNYVAHGSKVCVRCKVDEDEIARQIIAELRSRLLAPDRLAWLTEQLVEKKREQRADHNLSALRKDVKALEAKLTKARARLIEVSRDMVPDVEAHIRDLKASLDRAQKALADAETGDPVKELSITVEAAGKALWLLETALEGGNRGLLGEALRGIISTVKIGAEPHLTLTGRRRHRATLDGIVLRRGTGLDVLADLDASRSETVQVCISVEPAA